MARKSIEETVMELAQPITEKYEFELVDVEFIKEGANWYLRIYIDKPGGITIDDCKVVSEDISEELDKIDIIKQSYFLEVSSPGLERPLKKEKDFEKFKGEMVEVKLFKPLDGKKLLEGKLVGLKDNKVCIDVNEGIIEIEREKTAYVRRLLKF